MDQTKSISTLIENKCSLNQNNVKTTASYKEFIECLMYLATHTRPDISFSVVFLNKKQSNPTEYHWICLKRLLRYIKGTKTVCLNFVKLKSENILVGFSNANFF